MRPGDTSHPREASSTSSVRGKATALAISEAELANFLSANDRTDNEQEKYNGNGLTRKLAVVMAILCGLLIFIFFLTFRLSDACRKLFFTQNSIYNKEIIMEHDMDPCEDFYTYVCGRWNRTISREQNYTSLIEETQMRNMRNLELHLKCSSTKDLKPWAQLMKKTYESCKLGKQSTTDKSRTVAFVKNLAGPLIGLEPQVEDLEETLRRVHHRSLQNGLFTWGVTLDWSRHYDEIIQVLVLDPPKVSKKNDLALNPNHLSSEYVKDVLILLGATEQLALSKSLKIMEVNKLLNAQRNKTGEYSKLQDLLNKQRLTFEEFTQEFDSINFRAYFNEISPANSTTVLMTGTEYFTWLNSYLEKSKKDNKVAICDFLIWSAIDFFVPYMPEEFSRLRGKHGIANSGKFLSESRICLDAVTKSMNFAASSFFMDKVFDQESRVEVNQIILNVKKSFQDVLYFLQKGSGSRGSWLNGLQQILDMVEIGVPDHFRRMYRENIFFGRVKDSFPDLLIFATNFSKSTMLSCIDRVPLAFLFSMDLLAPNALFIEQPLLLIQVGLLTPPLFYVRQTSNFNYAGLGFALAHELAHSIEFLAKDEPSIKGYLKSEMNCLRRQYPNSQQRGNADQEDLADNIAIHTAYKAYVTYLNEKEQLSILEHKKDFFIHFGQIWCEDGSSFSLHNNNFHSPFKHRVNIPLSNLPDFSEVFNCRKGSAMNREKNCEFFWSQK